MHGYVQPVKLSSFWVLPQDFIPSLIWSTCCPFTLTFSFQVSKLTVFLSLLLHLCAPSQIRLVLTSSLDGSFITEALHSYLTIHCSSCSNLLKSTSITTYIIYLLLLFYFSLIINKEIQYMCEGHVESVVESLFHEYCLTNRKVWLT